MSKFHVLGRLHRTESSSCYESKFVLEWKCTLSENQIEFRNIMNSLYLLKKITVMFVLCICLCLCSII